jgi:8-hydroxy-5-deazaflavin:NADPH oxidoreductase
VKFERGPNGTNERQARWNHRRRPARAGDGTDSAAGRPLGRDRHDATNDFEPSDRDGRTSSEVVADLIRGARVVKAANTLSAAVLGSDPHEGGGQRVMFLSGDDVDAKAEVISLFEDAGFFTIDLGALITGGAMQQLGAPLAGVNLIRLSEAS